MKMEEDEDKNETGVFHALILVQKEGQDNMVVLYFSSHSSPKYKHAIGSIIDPKNWFLVVSLNPSLEIALVGSKWQGRYTFVFLVVSDLIQLRFAS